MSVCYRRCCIQNEYVLLKGRGQGRASKSLIHVDICIACVKHTIWTYVADKFLWGSVSRVLNAPQCTNAPLYVDTLFSTVLAVSV